MEQAGLGSHPAAGGSGSCSGSGDRAVSAVYNKMLNTQHPAVVLRRYKCTPCDVCGDRRSMTASHAGLLRSGLRYAKLLLYEVVLSAFAHASAAPHCLRGGRARRTVRYAEGSR